MILDGGYARTQSSSSPSVSKRARRQHRRLIAYADRSGRREALSQSASSRSVTRPAAASSIISTVSSTDGGAHST